MNPQQLSIDGNPVPLFACGKCGRVAGYNVDPKNKAEYMASAKDEAEHCCTCPTCGGEVRGASFSCVKCRRKEQIKTLERALEMSKLLTDDEWNQYYYYLSIPSGQHPELERLTKEKYNR